MVAAERKRKSRPPISVNGQPMLKPKKHCGVKRYTEGNLLQL